MSGTVEFVGHRILVVEDDFILASDTTDTLDDAGAEIIGPCQSEEIALRTMDEERPTVAVVDINLGHGPSFTLAHALKREQIPFVFTTGYGDNAIPDEFSRVPCLRKPIEPCQLLDALALALNARRQ